MLRAATIPKLVFLLWVSLHVHLLGRTAFLWSPTTVPSSPVVRDFSHMPVWQQVRRCHFWSRTLLMPAGREEGREDDYICGTGSWLASPWDFDDNITVIGLLRANRKCNMGIPNRWPIFFPLTLYLSRYMFKKKMWMPLGGACLLQCGHSLYRALLSYA